MPATLRFICDLPTGLHARPASLLAETARRHKSDATVTNEETGASAEGRSVLSLIALDVQKGHRVLVSAVGADEAALIEAIGVLAATHFGESLHLPPPAPGEAFVPLVPVPLRRMSARVLTGRPVSAGIGEGVAVVAGGLHLPERLSQSRCENIKAEQLRAENALAAVRGEIEKELASAGEGLRADLLRAHLGIMDDPALRRLVAKEIAAGRTACCAVCEANHHFAAKFGASASAVVRERAADLEDVCRRILGKLDPAVLGERPITLAGPSVVVAATLGVSQLMALDAAKLRGLVLGDVGTTSHVVILARSMQIPTLIAVDGLPGAVRPGTRMIVDGFGGFAVADASDDAAGYFKRDGVARRAARARIEPILRKPGRTRDGVHLEVAANAATPCEIRAAMTAGADSIGLLRTEMLFLDRAEPPSEDEQFELYRDAVEAAQSTDRSESARGGSVAREVIIRTLDIGGDKPAPYLPLAQEDNPFLGVRGLRLYHKFPKLIQAQLRAICRASGHGKVKVMAPMVSTMREARWFREQIARAQSELRDTGVRIDPKMPVGIMLEVPAAAAIVDQLAPVIDFISIGTNDLCQYAAAADRTNPEVAALNNPREPAFLRLLEQIASRARAAGMWAGLCGEMGGDVANLPLMVGLGLNEISVAAPALAPIKERLTQLDSRECRDLLLRAMDCESAEEVDALLGGTGGMPTVNHSPVHADLVLIDCDAANKDHAIQSLVGALHAAGRTSDLRAVEEAIWAREATYATALGFGFAIPHCRTDAVACPSIAFAKLRSPVDWGAADGQPVSGVIMLTVRKSDAEQSHLKLLAKLARKLMHEEFRERLLGSPDAATAVGILESELELVAA